MTERATERERTGRTDAGSSDVTGLPQCDPGTVGFDPARLTRLDDHFRALVDDGRLPGWSLLVAREGKIAHEARYGLRDIEAGALVEQDTVFRIYSMTKPITSVASMMLYERGLFELNDPIERYLPEFADMRVYVSGSDLKPVTVAATEPIRVWHLLTHTSGLTYGWHRSHPVDAIYRSDWKDGTSPECVDLAGAVKALASYPLQFQPGTAWNYSVATDVLGRLIEVLTGMSLDRFFADEIFTPLEMHDTTFDATPLADRLAALYVPFNGDLVRNDVVGGAALDPAWLSGGGGLVSTLTDYHRFTQLLRGGTTLEGVRLLSPRTLCYMVRNHLPGGADLASFGRLTYAESPYDGVGFGLGFAVVTDPVASRTLGSPGEFSWGGAAGTGFWVDPVEDITAVFMTQLMPSSTYPLQSKFRQMVYSALTS